MFLEELLAPVSSFCLASVRVKDMHNGAATLYSSQHGRVV